MRAGTAITAFPGGFRKLYTFFQPSGGLPGVEPQKTVDFRQKLEIWYDGTQMCVSENFTLFNRAKLSYWDYSQTHVSTVFAPLLTNRCSYEIRGVS